MEQLKLNRKQWNEQQRLLRPMLLSAEECVPALERFMSQHAVLHSAKMASSASWSYEDAIFDEWPETQMRLIPSSGSHSAVWLLWHMARIEDVTMNLLVAETPQMLHRSDWLEQMKVEGQDTGNGMDAAAIAELSATIDIPALRAYRLAVGRRTQAIARQLEPGALRRKVDRGRLAQIMA